MKFNIYFQEQKTNLEQACLLSLPATLDYNKHSSTYLEAAKGGKQNVQKVQNVTRHFPMSSWEGDEQLYKFDEYIK